MEIARIALALKRSNSVKKEGVGIFEMTTAYKKSVRVEITEETLSRLLKGGQVCAADFCCLDCDSKQCLWRLCLESCINTVKPVLGERLTRAALC